MADNPAPKPNMRDLMAAVAYVLMHWGWLEEEVRERIEAIEPDRLLSKGSIWAHWRAIEPEVWLRVRSNIEMLVDVRNCLAHGLCGAKADPRSADEPHVVCRTATGKRAIKMSELESVADALHLARNDVRDTPY
ncbi:hypothetical protein LB517_01385 [Mesorhizobium sp. BR1-1-12]|uniref:hypothetical protein n=1 Tax=unclassified Mesorhizobium TaxID=325217 RepID=UPI001CCC8D33|nr:MULTISPECIES: hypothetical protein [unclassified Mesorhizobium]MBZ9917103.1 hypothetical protein [Mesorhizobium sp. BR1-1-7]MBZ9968267.1 hypothetical protein [Mesorhizobium sp. BR1-1-12]